MDFDEKLVLLIKVVTRFTRAHEWRGDYPNREEYPLDLFSSVCLPFTAEEWCDIAMQEGEYYMGGCCGPLTYAQSIISKCFRESGWIQPQELAEVAYAISKHDPITEYVPFGDLTEPLEDVVVKTKDRWLEISPWDKIALIWQIVKDHYGPEVPRAHHKENSPLVGAISILSDSMYRLNIENCFRLIKDVGEPTSQSKVHRALMLSRVIPSLKVLNERIDELQLGSVEGFAIIDKEKGPDAVASNGYGHCIYATRGEVDAMFALWRKEDSAYKEGDRIHIDQRMGVRPVRVTVEKGIEFLD